MRKFKIRKINISKVETSNLFTFSPEQDRVQTLTKFSEDLKKYTDEEMPEIHTIRAWVDKELSKSLAKTKVHDLFKTPTKYSV